MKRNKERYLLYIGIVIAILPVFILRDYTPLNELRYLSIADEALREHHLFAFTNHGTIYADKPPLFLWAIMLCKWLTDAHHMWLLSFLSLLPAIGIARIMDRWVENEMDNNSRITALLMLFTSGLFLLLAGTLRMDMLMSFFIVLSLHTFWKMMQAPGKNRKLQWLFPLYLFLGLFSKGPLGLLIPLCCSVVYLIMTKRMKEFFHYWGWRTWSVLLCCCALWFGAVYFEGGKEYLNNLLFHQPIDRTINSFHHKEPFYYYFLHMFYCLAPWTLFILVVLGNSLRPQCVRSQLQKFFQIVVVTTFVLLSTISGKIQIYLLPLIPFLVYATATYLPRLDKKSWMRITIAIPAFLIAIALPAIIGLSFESNLRFLSNGLILSTATVLSIFGIYTLYLLYRERDIAGAIKHLGIGVLCFLFLGGFSLPKINPYIGYGKLCEKALKISKKQELTDIYTWKISRSNNMDVFLGQEVTELDKNILPTPNPEKPCLLLTRKKELVHFPDMETKVVGKYAIVVFK